MNVTSLSRRHRSRLIGAVTMLALGTGLLVGAAVALQTWSAASASSTPSLTAPPASAPAPIDNAASEDGVPDADDGAPGTDDGVIREGEEVTVFSDVPAVMNLTGELRDALQRATNDAAADGIAFRVNSGWRSAGYQEQLWQDAIVEYGSADEAARWVKTSETSEHVTGDAVDIGPFATTDWLAQHGSVYGLCQTYANESWHYELRPEAIGGTCPQMYADPSQAPKRAR